MVNHNHAFVSQFTILYKSYMILVAFVLTVVCNAVWLRFGKGGGDVGMQAGGNLGVKGWIDWVVMILPLKGRFSIVFFQLMFLTSIQIVYETIIELHYRFNKKRARSFGGFFKKMH